MTINTNIDEQLQELYQKKKKEDEANKPSNFDYATNEEKLVLPKGFTVCRIVDIPVKCESSFIKCDNEKIKLFKFPSLEENPDFILYKIIHHVLKQTWKGVDKEGKHQFDIPVKAQSPEVYRMVHNNGDLVEGQYGANGWGSWKKFNGSYRGTASNTTCFTNVINRQPFSATYEKKDADGNVSEETKSYGKEWCVENNHTLLLAKDLKSVGCPITIQNLLLKQIFPNFGNFQGYDVAVERLAADPYYQIWKAEHLTNNQDVIPHIVQGPLNEKEQTLETYDLNDLVKPSAYSFIYNNLKVKIGQIDKALGTDFLYELEQLVEKETGNAAGTPAGEQPSEPDPNKEYPKEEPKPEPPKEEPKPEPKPEPQPEPKPEPAPAVEQPKEEPKPATEQPKPEPAPAAEQPPVRQPAKAAANQGSVLDQAKALDPSPLYKNEEGAFTIDKLPDDQKALITGISADKTKLTFSIEDVSSCPYCNKPQPTAWDDSCVYCGVSYQD